MRRRLLPAALLAVLLAACTASPPPVRFIDEGMPASLSDWQLLHVADGRLQLNARVEAYELATPLFTDYAHKLRTVWMPEGHSARLASNGDVEFPVGTILSKTFYYPLADATGNDREVVLRSADLGEDRNAGGLALDGVRLIETRLLVHRAEGWIALPYVWNAAQTEARLMRGGDLVELTLVDAEGGREPIDYAVPDQNQCAGCHGTDLKSKAVFPIGPKQRHLDREIVRAAGQTGQLAHWQAIGYLDATPAPAAPAAVAWDDPGATLDARARAYLDINCGHCHSPQGAARTSGMWLDAATTDPLRLGRCKLPIAAGKGTGDRTWGIAPGDPDASILPFRMASTDPAVMMPELGRSVVHREGVALVRDWIAAMEAHDCSR